MEGAEEVKQHLDVADIVGEYLPLKPSGTASFKACCPFHQEKTPSFYVNRARQSWHCFGCNKGGDIISFVMEMEGMEFRDALELLAQKAGVTLPHFDAKTSSLKQRLYEVNDLASRYFRAILLQSPEASHARDYADKRQIDNLTGDLFKIGYALNSWDALSVALMSKGVTEDELVEAGLCGRKQQGGLYDRFRDRLMFAIMDVHGHVVGFTGRQLNPDAKEAKYVNTPETLIYKKSSVLYALDKAKGEIKSKNLCVIVEGNMDALSSHRINITNVVASSGTALTNEQLKLIGRFTKNLAIAFDADPAGLNATLRGLDLARAQDFQIKIITLSEQGVKDPDEAIAKDPTIWKSAIMNAQPIMDWIFKTACKNRNVSDAQEKRQASAMILPEIKRIADPIERDHWMQKLSESLQISETALRDALHQTNAQQPQSYRSNQDEQYDSHATRNTLHTPSRSRELAERILGIILRFPELHTSVPAHIEPHLGEDLVSLYRTIRDEYDPKRSQEIRDPAYLSPEYQHKDLVSYLTIRIDRDCTDQSFNGLSTELSTNLAGFIKLVQDEKGKRLEEEMRAAELAGDEQKILELTLQFTSFQSSAEKSE
jgi:DNA primase